MVGEVATIDFGVISPWGRWVNELLHLGDEEVVIRVGGVRVLPEEGFSGRLKWVLWAVAGLHLLGRGGDGRSLTALTGVSHTG